MNSNQLVVRACRRAARDHCDPMPGITPIPASFCRVERIERGEIEITYAREGCRAIYGFDADGNLTLYAD